jgi:hypothetical protein
MAGHTFTLNHSQARERAVKTVIQAPAGYVVKIMEPKRSRSQNDKMWAMLTDISHPKPKWTTGHFIGQPIEKTPDEWKFLVMNHCGHECQFMTGLSGQPFPIGLKSSVLKVSQMRDLIEWMYGYGAEHNIQWTEPKD